ncbi:MYOSIN HEAVY CHAIN-RELATED [Ceraceosorus bombacis]|uniref:MYOSIN HEAVY CHAIN-RELATED n=1 Tax=Ceraceosorus bombacis TaxID=401625 RepID=A0A0P1BQF9_9BASI|nr:MYOSIN HEAVY CHAIN-RELATED [Ceraceosorus bombacis]
MAAPLSVEEALAPVEAVTAAASIASGSRTNGSSIASTSATADSLSSAEDGWPADEDEEEKSAVQLKAELKRAKQERNAFEAQYQGLLSKLTAMRNTLGERLRQDAEELDRRESNIESLQAQLTTQTELVETLKNELVGSHADVERLQKSLDLSRNAAPPDRTRELAESAERLRIEAEGWESAYTEERGLREEAESRAAEAERRRDEAEKKEMEEATRAEREGATARELQAVLEEFQAAQENELQRALGDYQEKYDTIVASLEEYKQRSTIAESKLADYRDAAERNAILEKEVKEKNLLVGKLRHEAVILNEHLTEALRRLRSDTSDSNVDRRLVTNLLVQFLTTPRADAKRFEMLSLIASVLQFTDEQRESTGLQRVAGASGSAYKGMPPGVRRGSSISGHTRSEASSGGTGDESFSNLFLEFLLSEADKAKPTREANGQASEPTSPKTPTTAPATFNLGSLAALRRPSTDLFRGSSATSSGTRTPLSPSSSTASGPMSPPPSSSTVKGKPPFG